MRKFLICLMFLLSGCHSWDEEPSIVYELVSCNIDACVTLRKFSSYRDCRYFKEDIQNLHKILKDPIKKLISCEREIK
jgi:hypothetical protein